MSILHELEIHLRKLTTQQCLIIDDSLFTDIAALSKYIDEKTNVAEYDIIIFDYATSYRRIHDEIQLSEQISQLTLPLPWLIVTSNFNFYQNSLEHIVYYPIFVIDVIDHNRNFVVEIQNYRLHTLGYLTFNYYYDRLLTLVKLFQQPWFDNCLINFPRLCEMSEHQIHNLESSKRSFAISERASLDGLISNAPYIADQSDPQILVYDLANKGFTECYINLSTESDYSSPQALITEKSIKPMLTGQISAVMGNTDINSHLINLGFEVFDHYINTSASTVGIRQRLEQVLSEITNLVPDLPTIWNDTLPQRRHNYELARSLDLKYTLQQELREKLN